MTVRLKSWGVFRRRSDTLAVAAGAITFVAGALVLLGWAIGRSPRVGLLAGVALSTANSAVGFILCGISLGLRSLPASARIGKRSARAIAAFALAIGAATLIEHLAGANFGIDTLLFTRAAIAEGSAHAGRMSFGSALSLTLAATALVAVPRRLADWCAISVSVISLMSLAGYLYSLSILGRLISYGSFPLLSALIFIVLSAGTLCAEPDRGLARDLFDKGPSGAVLRRLVPAALAIPVLLAWLVLEGSRVGVFEAPVGVGLMAVATIIAFLAVIWVTARSIDASESRRESAALGQLESEADFQDLFDSAPVGLSHSRPDGSLVAVNEAFVRTLGYADNATVMRVNSSDLYANPEERVSLLAALASDDQVSREVQLRRADGASVWVQMHVRVIKRDGFPLRYESALIDLTERKRLEQQFAQAQKMEAVGRLAGGIAHDFNNMLTVIRSYCDLVVLETAAQSPIRGDLDEIARAADQAAVLCRQLLAFSRKQVMLPQVFNPNAVVQEAHSMLRRLLPSAVRCELELGENLGMIRADPGNVNQVLMNLGINASDAMPDGGTLHIATLNCTLPPGSADARTGAADGDFVCIAVSDSGLGMDAETLSHMYEPFFTTKPVGKGTGLGLATVYGIMEQNHGHVEVQSEPGLGTRFMVYFPRVAASEVIVSERLAAAIPPHAHASRVVLVVEDDDSVRASIVRILTREGHTVLSARHGGEGIRVGNEHRGPIDLVISDLMMPEMGGRQFAERLMRVHPESRVLLISGYTDDEVLRKGGIDPRFAFLAKPFSVDELVQKVEGVLEAV